MSDSSEMKSGQDECGSVFVRLEVLAIFVFGLRRMDPNGHVDVVLSFPRPFFMSCGSCLYRVFL